MNRHTATAVIVSSLLLGPASGAGEAEARRAAEELLLLTGVDKTLDGLRAQMTRMIEAQTASVEMTPEIRERMQGLRERLLDVLFEELSWERLRDGYVDLYAETFSEEELRGLLAFYRTPLGRSFLEKMPRLVTRSMELGQSRAQKAYPRIQEIIREFLEGVHGPPGEAEPATSTDDAT